MGCISELHLPRMGVSAVPTVHWNEVDAFTSWVIPQNLANADHARTRLNVRCVVQKKNNLGWLSGLGQ